MISGLIGFWGAVGCVTRAFGCRGGVAGDAGGGVADPAHDRRRVQGRRGRRQDGLPRVAGHARHHAAARHVQVPGAHPGKHGDYLFNQRPHCVILMLYSPCFSDSVTVASS